MNDDQPTDASPSHVPSTTDTAKNRVSVYDRQAVNDETSKKYDAYTRLQLAERLTKRREQLMVYVTDYVLGTVHSDTFNLIEGRYDRILDEQLVNVLERQRSLRKNNQMYIRRQTAHHARKHSIEQLNKLLRYYDEVYRDAVDLIDLTENTGIALKAPVEQTLDTFLDILRVILAEANN